MDFLRALADYTFLPHLLGSLVSPVKLPCRTPVKAFTPLVPIPRDANAVTLVLIIRETVP